MTSGPKNTVKSVRRVFSIVEQLKTMDGAGVTELASQVELPVSTVHSHLNTLQDEGYVVKSDKEYRLARRFIHLGDHAKHSLDMYRVGEQAIDWLTEETGETANLMLEEYGRGIYVMSKAGSRGLRNYSHVRRREYLHSTAAGKAMLSMLPESRIDEIIDAHGLPQRTEHTITDRDELLETLSEARERGYAFNDQENTVGIRAVGAPVERADGSYGAVSVSGPINHLTDQELRETLPELVHNTARSIEIELVS